MINVFMKRAGYRWRGISALFLISALSSFAVNVMAGDAEAKPRSMLKVCADPALMPFSSENWEGMENKIAELLAKELNAELSYKFFPQRIGFIRNTLRSETGGGEYECDVVMSVPEHFELADTTKPYYATTYALVYVKGRGLDSVTEPEMLAALKEQGTEIKFGLFDRGPAQLWVFKHGLMEYMVPYQFQMGDVGANPNEVILQDLYDGKINATIVSAPFAGYFAQGIMEQGGDEFVILPLENDPDLPEMKYVYNMSMGVRYGDSDWKETLNNFIDKYQRDINDIISSYGIPITEVIPNPKPEDDDD